MSDTGPDPLPPRPRRRRPLRWLLRGVALLVVLTTGLLLALAYPPGGGRVVPLPEWARARIEARIDASMPAGEVTVGSVGVALSRGRLMPRIRFTDLRLSEAGQPRVILPALEVEMDRASMLRGDMRPRRVAILGAGLRVARAADGSLDLAFAGTESAEPRDLAQTMAGFDRMFQQTVFSRLERVEGQGMTLSIEDSDSGEILRISDATIDLHPAGDALILSAEGALEDRPDSTLSLTFVRHADLSETVAAAEFTNLHSRDIALFSDALELLTLVDAPLSGRLSTVLFDDGSVGTLSGALDVGAGQAVPGGGVDPLPLNAMMLSFDYDAASARMWINDFTLDAPALSVRLSGHATLQDGPIYLAQVQLDEITADPPGVFAAPVSFAGGAVDLRLQLYPFASVEFGQAVLFDEGLHLTMRGRVAAEPEGLAVRLDAEVPDLEASRVAPLWPVSAIPHTRDWIDENVLGGTIQNVRAGLRRAAGEPGTRVAVTFDFHDALVRGLRRMAPIEGGAGYLDISDNAVTVALHEGHVTAPDGGDLDLAGSVLRISDTREREPPMRIDLSVEGPISSALTLIAAEPFTLLDQFPFDPATVANGRADLRGTLSLILQEQVRPEDVTFDFGGTLRGVTSRELVPGRVLRAASLTLAADNSALSIGGQADLDGLEANATWSRALGPDSTPDSRVTGTATLTPQSLAAFGVRLPDGILRGRGAGDFNLDLARGQPPRLAVTSDLAGLALSVPSLGWSLSSGGTGQLSADILLGEAPAVPRLEISGAGLQMAGSVQLAADQSLDRLSVDRLTMGNWLDVSGALVAQGNGLRVQVNGGEVDLRGLPQGAGGGGDSLPLDIRLDRLTVTDAIYFTNFSAGLGGTPMSGDFRGLVGGQIDAQGTVVAEANGMAVRLSAADGGGLLRAAEIYPGAYGGVLDLILRPLPGPNRYSGLLTINNPRLRNAPVIAELLNAISVVGLLEQLASGEGVALGDVRVVFSLEPDVVTVTDATAIGPSMGLSLDGIYNIPSRYMDFEGVLSPFYMVNGLVGGLFTPRREGLFGFTYRLTGSPDNSEVSVNPLSVLTPGIFREIFRRPPPEAAQ